VLERPLSVADQLAPSRSGLLRPLEESPYRGYELRMWLPCYPEPTRQYERPTTSRKRGARGRSKADLGVRPGYGDRTAVEADSSGDFDRRTARTLRRNGSCAGGTTLMPEQAPRTREKSGTHGTAWDARSPRIVAGQMSVHVNKV
jgi:hypothetical protein